MVPRKNGVQFLGKIALIYILRSRTALEPGSENWERKKR